MTSRAEIVPVDSLRVTTCSLPTCTERGRYRFTGSDGVGGTVVGWLCEEHAPDTGPMSFGPNL